MRNLVSFLAPAEIFVASSASNLCDRKTEIRTSYFPGGPLLARLFSRAAEESNRNPMADCMAKLRLCHRCKARIPQERLEALPDTWLCLPCSREIGGDYHVSFNEENVGKAGSLKKNYGGINIRKRRRRIEPKEED